MAQRDNIGLTLGTTPHPPPPTLDSFGAVKKERHGAPSITAEVLRKCFVNCNYSVYSATLLFLCPLPKLACVSELHLALILYLQNDIVNTVYVV